MIDIHSHIVWGLDDGPASVEESLAMLDSARASGTTEIVATPHSNQQYAYQADLLQQRIAELAERTGHQPEIHRGCEFYLSFDTLEDLLQLPAKYTIDGKQYLLVEFDFARIGKHGDIVLERLLAAGVIPIICHPERNEVLRRSVDRLERWVERGCLTQVTALSLTGGFGRSAQSAGTRLLERGLVHVIASDAHDPSHRTPALDRAYALVLARYGDDAAEILFRENPLAIIHGDPLPGGKQVVCESPPWWKVWQGG